MNILKLCLVTQQHYKENINAYCDFIENAVEGGVTCVQLRKKNLDKATMLELANRLLQRLRPHHVPLIINDDVMLCKEIDADGVHVGQQDMHPDEARRILGPDKIIGLSVESVTELAHANQLRSINYVAASAIFPSKNKLCKQIWGIEGLQKFVLQSYHPVIAIGGINENNVQEVLNCGVAGIAVISAIHDANNAKQAASILRQRLARLQVDETFNFNEPFN